MMVINFKPEINSTAKLVILLWVACLSWRTADLFESGVLTPKALPEPGPKSLVGYPANKFVTRL